MKQHGEGKIKMAQKNGRGISTAKLRTWQLFVAAVLALHALILILMSAGNRVPIYAQYLASDTLQSKLTGTAMAGPAVHELVDVQMTAVVAVLLLGTAAGLVLLATKGRMRYEQWLQAGRQPVRYAIGALVLGLTLLSVALLGGLRDLATLKLVAAAVVVGAVLLYEAERQRVQLKQKLGLVFVVGVATLAVAWLVILETLVASAAWGGAVPPYLWWLAGTVAAGWVAVILNEVLARRGYSVWKKYLFSEAVWLVVMAVLNIAFCWQVFAGLLKP